MAELRQKIKNAVNETRMLVLGSQILLGFQLQAVFQDTFDRLPGRVRDIDGIALALMLVAIASLIAPSAFHRIAENGEDSDRLHRFATGMAAFALLPFALSFGLNIFIAVDRSFGLAPGAGAGLTVCGVALFFWYGLELMHRQNVGKRQRTMAPKQSDRSEKTPLPAKIEQMLIEARVILPGAQALLGFQLTIMMMQSFDRIPASSKLVHLIGLCLVTLSVILLMVPAAYHRLVYFGEDTSEFYRVGSLAVTAATVPLALGIASDVYVVVAKIWASPLAGVSASGCVAVGFVGVWHVYPLVLRNRN